MPTQRISAPADKADDHWHSSNMLPSFHPYQAGGSAAQLDLARDAGAAVGNGEAGYWRMQNGYLLPDQPSGLAQVTAGLSNPNTRALALTLTLTLTLTLALTLTLTLTRCSRGSH